MGGSSEIRDLGVGSDPVGRLQRGERESHRCADIMALLKHTNNPSKQNISCESEMTEIEEKKAGDPASSRMSCISNQMFCMTTMDPISA